MAKSKPTSAEIFDEKCNDFVRRLYSTHKQKLGVSEGGKHFSLYGKYVKSWKALLEILEYTKPVDTGDLSLNPGTFAIFQDKLIEKIKRNGAEI